MVDAPPNPEPSPAPPPAPDEPKPVGKLLVEFGPVLAFFVSYFLWDMFVATGVFMVAITAALAYAWIRERRLPRMTLVTAAFVLVLGGLTLYFGSATFIQLKPTIVYLLFAVILTTGLATKRLYLRSVFGASFSLTDRGWRLLTMRWIGFFLFLGALNEVVRTQFSETFWVNFKLWGLLILIFGFSMVQVPFLTRHAPPEEAEKEAVSDESAEG